MRATRRFLVPTQEAYAAMSLKDLETLVEGRERQVKELRLLYENFHYEVEKRFRHQVLDAQDSAASLAKIHGNMQLSMFTRNREALASMRLRQEANDRERRAIMFGLGISTVIYWVYLRQHYVNMKHAELHTEDGFSRDVMSTWNPFFSKTRSARTREMGWEKDARQSSNEQLSPKK